MSYANMARSHVKELLREAFELGEVVADADGDLPFPCGSALFYVSVVDEGRRVRVWSQAVMAVHIDKAVLRELNATNAGLSWSRVYATGDAVFVEGSLPVEPLRPEDLARLCVEVGSTADSLGTLVSAVHGGAVCFPDGQPADADGEA